MSRVIIIYRRSIIAAIFLAFVLSMWGIESLYANSIWKIKTFEPGIKDKVIIIDPGHGGADPGATYGDKVEKDINLSISDKILGELQKKKVKAYLTRGKAGGLNPEKAMNRAERRVNLNKRKQFGLDKKGNIFVSIHTNSINDPSVSGIVIFYHKTGKYNKLLADSVAAEIVKNTKEPVTVKEANYLVIYQNEIPSILVEVGFISNNRDRANITNNEYQNTFAEAVVKGIEVYTKQLGKAG